MIAALLVLAMPTTAAPGPTSPAVSAKAFVDGIYRSWLAALKRGNAMYQPPRDERLYVPELAALLMKDVRISSRTGDLGVIDWVILCSCQDDGGLGYRVSVPAASASAATAKVALSFGGKYSNTLTLKLVKLPGGWRIADVADTDMPSLLAMLRRELRGKK
jgi:hypothetical protein